MSGFQLPTSESGEILPHDHPAMVPGRQVIRRVSEDHVVNDDNRGCRRLSSTLFKNDPKNGYLSIDFENCITELGVEPRVYVTSPRWFGALILDIGQFRIIEASPKREKLQIGMVPLAENVCHAAVWGKITPGEAKTLQRNSNWLVEIPDVEKLSVES